MKAKLTASFIILFIFFSLSNLHAGFNQEWVQRIPMSANYEHNPSISTDKNGNIYVLSTFDTDTTSGYHNVIKLTKYLPDGTQSWSVNYDNPSNTSEIQIDFLVSGNSDIFILGKASISFKGLYLVLKYNSSGVLQWAFQHNTPGSDYPSTFTIDNSGNIYVAGSSSVSDTVNSAPTVIKLSPGGVLQWVKSINKNYVIGFSIGGIVTDLSNNIYFQYSYLDFESTFYKLIKFNSIGDSVWERQITWNGMTGYVGMKGLKRDSLNKIYYALERQPYLFAPYLVVSKCDTSGVILSNFIFNTGTVNSTVSLSDFRIMNDNSFLILGRCYLPTFLSNKILLCKFDASGNILRTVYTSYNSNFGCYGTMLALDNNSNIYFCGQTYVSTNSGDYLTVKYNSSLDSLYSILYNGPANNNDYATSIAVDTGNNVYVTGFSTNADNSISTATIKYSQISGIKKISGSVPEHFTLYQNYPNPFNPSTTIEFDIPPMKGGGAVLPLGKRESEGVRVRLSLYDLIGREVATLVNDNLKPGRYKMEFDGSLYTSSVYFYKLQTESFSNTKRMVLIK